MTKDHPTLALAIGSIFLTTYVDWTGSVVPCACHAVLVPECGRTMSLATPEHAACPKWPVLGRSDSYAPR